jgi:hypothetical protein
MKTSLFYILVMLLAAIPMSIHEQNLAFSKALLISTLDTVPNGKVWKVESAMSSSALSISTNSTSSQNGNTSILVDGVNIVIKSTWGSSYSTSALSITDLPIWLPAGTTLGPGSNVVKVSVIEFTVVP